MKFLNEYPWIPYFVMYGVVVLISLIWAHLIDKQNNNEDDKSNEGQSES
jgi:hypothetical protein